MSVRTDVIYLYDGSFEGLLTCVFESFQRKEIPLEILVFGTDQQTLYTAREIETDSEKSARVSRAIPLKISPDALEIVCKGYLTCHPQKELLILKFLYLGFRYGARVMDMLADDTVNALFKAVQFLGREAHLSLEFLRFSEYNHVLVAIIEPKNQVLPLMAKHFCDRFGRESFMIYDKTNKVALAHSPSRTEILPAEEFALPKADEEEKNWRALWQVFYDTIGIEERYNPRCRMNHMPKRYWKHMTEFAHLFPEEHVEAEPAYPLVKSDEM